MSDDGKSAFVIHGPDRLQTLELADFLRHLEYRPVILEQQPDLGLAIIEKFEHYAKLVDVAFAIMTPDDVLTDSNDKSVRAARQNVLIEVGWFMHRLGRSHVVLLVKEGTDLPSDLHGLIYAPFRNSIQETTETIRQRLESVRS